MLRVSRILQAKESGIMLTELRAGFLLVVSLVFFLIIIAVLALSTFMTPTRWSERPRAANGTTS
jgi:Tfp pilus assembly protein PilX